VANGAREGSSGAGGRKFQLAFSLVRPSTCTCRTQQRYMVRRRSTVRFRKGAPGWERFSNTEPCTSFDRVALECQMSRRAGARDLEVCRAVWAGTATSIWGTGPGLARNSAHTGRAIPCHAGLLRVMNALGQGSPPRQIDLVASGNLSGLLRSQADMLVDLLTRHVIPA
jgi:hypothetical protein